MSKYQALGHPERLLPHFDAVAKNRGMARVGPIEMYPDGNDIGVRALVEEQENAATTP